MASFFLASRQNWTLRKVNHGEIHYEAFKWESLLPWLDNKESAHVKDQISLPFGPIVTTSVS